jgi:hypothetical protein
MIGAAAHTRANGSTLGSRAQGTAVGPGRSWLAASRARPIEVRLRRHETARESAGGLCTRHLYHHDEAAGASAAENRIAQRRPEIALRDRLRRESRCGQILFRPALAVAAIGSSATAMPPDLSIDPLAITVAHHPPNRPGERLTGASAAVTVSDLRGNHAIGRPAEARRCRRGLFIQSGAHSVGRPRDVHHFGDRGRPRVSYLAMSPTCGTTCVDNSSSRDTNNVSRNLPRHRPRCRRSSSRCRRRRRNWAVKGSSPEKTTNS